MHTILTSLLVKGETRQIYPRLHFPLHDDWDIESKLRNVSLPFIEDSNIHEKSNIFMNSIYERIVLQYGDFVSVYGSQSSTHRERMDVVVTCFFIDTGRNILDYIEVIRFVLKTGGVWINVGPLHYHNAQAVPYSYRDVLHMVQLLGFELLKEEKLLLSYCGEEEVSMKPEIYHTPIAAFRKREDGWKCPSGPSTYPVQEAMKRPNYVIKR